MKESVFKHDDVFELELGGRLNGFELAYTTSGLLNEKKDNVVWVCHALTGNANVEEWWSGLFGENKFFDPKDYFIICANILGGCNGSTGPLSIEKTTNHSYYHNFPRLTNRDMVEAFNLLRENLSIDKIKILIGASLGGQHALEWSIMYPSRIDQLVCMATNGKRSPWSIAFNESQRMAIRLDPSWKESFDEAGKEGMKVARTIALLSYRGYDIYQDSQFENDDHKVDGFKAVSYQQYQGEKISKRFSAYTYMLLTDAMDSHNIGRGRKSFENALGRIEARCLLVGIRSDLLFPYKEQAEMSSLIRESSIALIDSNYGHDGFLVETEKIETLLKQFLDRS